MMEKIFRWLAGVFHVEVVWIDKGQGRWVKRRRYHPVLQAAVIAALLFGLYGAYGAYRGVTSFLVAPRRPAQETLTPPLVLSSDWRPDQALSFDQTVSFDWAIWVASSDQAVSADQAPGILPAPPDPEPIPQEVSVKEGEYWVRIVKKDFALYLYRGIKTEKRYRVGVGKNSGDKLKAGDNRTPNGIFTVQSIENSRAWTHDFRDGKGVIEGAYGPWFIRLRTKWKGIGIHGTHDPDSRGTMVSEGCVRMLNDELEELKKIAFRGMKVVIED
ncbi:MAG: L,D-transpeptidase [Synergistaceae bacterium]|jgi:lipoprotein-anchoring transpeptidase ErfK/SrfK|nr:L,D-transpeptidase [Synergistaceae bacterium]